MSYSALAAEVTPDYDERTSLTAFSGVVAVVGYMVGSVATRIITSALGLGIAAFAVASTFFLPPGQDGIMFLIVAVTGLGLSTHWVIPWAMLPDVVEYDEAATGQRREGMYYGVYGLVDKITRTMGIFAVGWALQLFGYVANVEQTARSLFGIRLFFGPVSAVLLLLAVPVLLSYPITRASHASLRRKLSEEAVDATQSGDEV